MTPQDFTSRPFVEMFFRDLDRYVAALGPRPGRVLTLEWRDRKHLEKCERPGRGPDYFQYRGLRIIWTRAT